MILQISSCNKWYRKFIGSWQFWLGVITLIAIVVRSIPAWINAAWGCDLGIYYGIASSIIEKGQLFVPYTGWGSSYNFFPITYIFTALAHWITGIDILWLMPRVIPILGSLTVVVLYFIVFELLKDRKIALISAALLAVAPFHVYQTSHVAHLTTGHLFMLLSLYLFLKYKQDKMMILPLSFSTALLILSHHLTTYFYLISIVGIIVYRELNRRSWSKKLMGELIYISATAEAVFLYWAFVAKPVYYSFMENGLGFLENWQVIALFYIILYGSLFLIFIKRKLNLTLFPRKKQTVVRYKKALTLFLLSVIGLILAEILFIFVKIPATNIKLNIPSIIYSFPIVIFVGFSVSGLEYMKGVRNKDIINGWLLVIFISFMYSFISRNTTLFPDRHIEYLMVPMCITAAIGVRGLVTDLRSSQVKIFNKVAHATTHPVSAEVVIIGIIGIIIISNATAVYPARDALGVLDESIPKPCINALYWMKENLDRNNTVIATDLRLSNLVWAEGFNATFDTTNTTWTAVNWTECVEDLDKNEFHERANYVFIDDIMKEKVVYLGSWCSLYMSNESYEKFSQPPFELVYRKATFNSLMEEIHWAEIYYINWSYIEKYENISG
jgi:4-amino-4-deoxy-L-arabinose transferase-like glycosyltransferase